MAAYLSVIPFLLLFLSSWISAKYVRFAIGTYTLFTLIVIHFLMMFDLGLYGAWGIRLDSTPFIYLDTPKEMFASVQLGVLIIGVVVWLLTSFLFYYLFDKIVINKTTRFDRLKLWYSPMLLVQTALLVVVMRGGLQTIPINQSSVYVFDEMFANHAAINFAWNLSHSIKSKSYDKKNPFVRVDIKEAQAITAGSRSNLVATHKDSTRSILRNDKPNIILIIWESLTAKIVEPLGGETNVTTQLNALVGEGILFDHFYANGDRSDKGLVAIFSGYYPQPDKSIMKLPAKSRSLPMLGVQLAKLGYQNSFYYGGDLNFSNMSTYFRQGGISHLVDEKEFDEADQNSKWGVHDHVVFERLKRDLSEPLAAAPFFKTLFTLSSHEPFEFPDTYKFGKDTEENSFRSAHAYTDAAVGGFVAWAKEQSWWDNTLIVIMADHGHALPKHEGPFNSPKKYQIPMLWLGGVLKETNIRIHHICSQKDFAYSLLDMLGGDAEEFKWSHDIFRNGQNHFTQYIYNKGFGTIDSSGYVVYDYVSDRFISTQGDSVDHLKNLGLSITQTAFQDFIERE
jgi:phosphoglycerol transferase MdoB-like AlkP superfamily enzyme